MVLWLYGDCTSFRVGAKIRGTANYCTSHAVKFTGIYQMDFAREITMTVLVRVDQYFFFLSEPESENS